MFTKQVLMPSFNGYKLELFTNICNSGDGIDTERINHLFIIFGELKKKQSIQKVKDFNIGVGLNSSLLLSYALEGEVKFIKSENNLT